MRWASRKALPPLRNLPSGTTIHETHEANPHCSPVRVISWIVILHEKKARPFVGCTTSYHLALLEAMVWSRLQSETVQTVSFHSEITDQRAKAAVRMGSLLTFAQVG
jgi:hypothetical protein